MSLYKITFYVPESQVEVVKNALFNAGAGHIGNYDRCAWQVKGEGQFRALSGSQPFLGKQEKLERVSEFRVELACDQNKIKQAISALKNAHPYEEPAYEVVGIIDVNDI